ncbi:hypothetical protein JJC03_04470 [Flavobacterium oreochromis]|uniref:hypothetical protein n=1 Tax=Flavobacterium oreochromis TaxID=2906078 RepID=UPI001CE69298|nr:hypothetical protein [Flavobacterium oreochromis]QYS87192.1 hypothetical protein JJC03_04400 [Flavobacterium oreochromis]QYS87204.1 hypothetical protein JJC03_04470 [Flavobacterium oreochromis]
MTNKNETPRTWEQEKNALLMAQILTQSHQLAIILENIQLITKGVERIQNTWENVEREILQQQTS